MTSPTSTATRVIDIFSRNSFEGELKYEGTNPISDEWGNIEIEGEALADALGKFGTWTVCEAAAP